MTSKQMKSLRRQMHGAILLIRCGNYYMAYGHDELVISTLAYNETIDKLGTDTAAGYRIPGEYVDQLADQLVEAGYQVMLNEPEILGIEAATQASLF